MVYNIDENNFHPGPGSSPELWQVGIRRGQYKLIWGLAGMLKKTSRNKIFQAKSKVQKINAWNLMGQVLPHDTICRYLIALSGMIL